MKRTFALIFVLAMLIGLFAGCKKDGDSASSGNNGSTEKPPVSNDIFSTDKVNYFDADGGMIYRIVRAEENTVNASRMLKLVRDAFGVSVRNMLDTEEDGTDVYEILVGDTNRPESAQALDYLMQQTGGRYKDFIICTIGKKIVVNALTEDGLADGIEYFAKTYLKKDGVEGGILYTYATEGDFINANINGNAIGRFSVIRPHFNSSWLTQVEMEKMLEELRNKAGYQLFIEEDAYVEEGQYEIVVGNTNRPGVEEIKNYDEYHITIKGTKVYLNGGSPYATAMAVSEFAKMIVSGSVTDENSVVGDYSNAINNYDKASVFTPKWYDTFDGSAIDLSKWRIMSGSEFGRTGKNNKFSGMSDDPNHVFVADGNFWIFGQETATQYLGGTITTDTSMNYQYGYLEKSAIVPDGDGFWSLLWLSGYQCPYSSPEIDVNECFGNASITAANCHAWPTAEGKALYGWEHTSLDQNYSSQKRYTCPDGKKLSDEYHTYGFLWDETQMTFTADGTVFFSYDITKIDQDIEAFVNSRMFIRLSYSVGRDNNSLDISNCTPEEWQNTSKFGVDYIYLYQLENGKGQLNLLK